MDKPIYLYETTGVLPSEEDCPVGVVINLEKKPDHFHCGLLYWSDGEVNVLHLATYKQLWHDDSFKHFSHLIKPNIHPLRLKLMVPFCKLVHQKVQNNKLKIPYGINYEGYSDIDSESGELHLAEGTNGLTCSTFVMTMFHSRGIDLIDISNWPHRPEEDQNWKNQTITALYNVMNQWKIPLEFIRKLYLEQNLVRYKPQEVAASSALYEYGPAPSDSIINEGQNIMDYMNQ